MMKKTISMLLLLCSVCLLLGSVCLLLGSCSGYKKGKSFDKDFLKTASLENMPLPNSENYSLNTRTEGREYLKAEMSRADFHSYVESFAEYMRKRTDIYYFGLQESEGLIAEMIPHRVVCEVGEDFQCDNDRTWYAFSYSLKDALSDYGRSCDHVRYESFICITMEYDGEVGEAEISIVTNPVFGDCIDESLSTPYVFELASYGTHYRISGVKKDLSGEITLPETYKGLPVKEIDVWGFSANDGVGSTGGVTKVVIPDCYESIGGNAFNFMPNLQTVVIGNGVKEIGPGAFEGCTKLESVTFGNAVEAIYAKAFLTCEKLDNVVLPASLKEITYRAFGECRALKSIVIPGGVEEILTDAFYENDSLTDIYCEIEAQPDGWDSDWCGNYSSYLANNDVKVTFGYGGEQPTVTYSVSFNRKGGYQPVFLEKTPYLYASGSEVTFYLEPIESGETVAIYVNGVRHSVGAAEEVPQEGGDGKRTLWKYSFLMPEGHALISFQTEGAVSQ